MGEVILDPIRVFEVIAADVPLWRNIVAVYDGTSELERREGRDWYARAWDFARMLAETHWNKGPTIRNIGAGTQRKTLQAAGIVALLSQNKRWERNQTLAIEVFKSRGALAGGTFERVRDKCREVFDGADPFIVASGPKITSFLACIVAQGRCADVAVDRHAAHIAYGQILDDRQRGQRLRQTQSRDGYQSVVECYQYAANHINERDSEELAPAQLQAITWVSWRNVLLGEDRGFLTVEQTEVVA